MAQSVMQHAFHAGEWAPQLNARVDLQKYHSAAALMKNFFVDYRGGCSTRSGTQYVLQCLKSSGAIVIIPFQASFNVNYVLELGDRYMRFHSQGAPVLETAFNITGITQATPGVVTTSAPHNFAVGDWVFITGVAGMTQINGRYFQVLAVTATTLSLGKTLNGANQSTSSYSVYTSGGTVARVYTIQTPYFAPDLAKLKWAQNVNTLVLTHPNYPPAVLTLISAANWTLQFINFGTTLAAPASPTATVSPSSAGTANYGYVVTAVDANGQESAPSVIASALNKIDIRTTAGSVAVSWSAVPGAVSYNVYKAQISYSGGIPAGSQFGFIGNVTALTLIDGNIPPNYAQTPPIIQNPFLGSGVVSYTVTTAGTYTTVPTATVAAPPSGTTATCQPVLGVVSISSISSGGLSYAVNQIVNLGTALGGTVLVTIKVTSVGGGGAVTGASIMYAGSIISGNTPSNPLIDVNGNAFGGGVQINFTWGLIALNPLIPGTGYTSVPAVTFSAGTAAATANLGSASAGNPSVPGYYQQRLVLAGPTLAPNQFNMSQPGSFYNYNTANPIQASDAIQGTLVAQRLQTIKSMTPMSKGLLMLTDQQAWIVSGGGGAAAITPIDATADGQSYEGAADLPPIIVNFDFLYVQAKGTIVRDLTYNFYTSIYTGTDITVLSSHLFFGHRLLSWTYAEEPFKLIWAVREDGVMLSLTFVKEQEVVGWAQHTTQGFFQWVTTNVESVSNNNLSTVNVDTPYLVVLRTINGVNVQYIERMPGRFLQGKVKNTWAVDAGYQYNGAPITTLQGLDALAGMAVVGVADGIAFTGTVSTDGALTLGTAASLITVGLAFTPQLQTLRLDLGEPTVQGKRKKIAAVTVRAQETLGLSIGRSFSSLVPMKDFVVGNIGTMSNTAVTDLVTDDGRTEVDPLWDVPGQYAIQQSNPFPATILGVIPEIVVGDR